MDEGKPLLWTALGVVGLLCAMGVANEYIHAAGAVTNAPAKLISRTFEADNIQDSYEKFRDTYTRFQSRVSQIQTSKTMKLEPYELAGQRQSCRDIVATYNADSMKVNHNIFKVGGGELPDRLDMEDCNK